MKNTRTYTTSEVMQVAHRLARRIRQATPRAVRAWKIYAVPRGGIPVAYALVAACDPQGLTLTLTTDPGDADLVVDDIVDSGNTRERYKNKRFAALVAKDAVDPIPVLEFFAGESVAKDCWVVFPWEQTEVGSGEDIVTRLISFIGDDPNRPGLRETPGRFLTAWQEWTRGYGLDPAEMLKTFEDGAEKVNEMVLVHNIPIYSVCEHHLVPMFGKAYIGYIPNGRIVGLSKLVRVANAFARRLQVQERLTNQIADLIDSELRPLGVGVVIELRHLCMETRGVNVPGSVTTTSALRGAMFDTPSARAEFFSLVRGGRNG